MLIRNLKYYFAKTKRKIKLSLADWVSEVLVSEIENQKSVDRKQIKKKFNGYKVSNHALLRYFERMEGYDLDEVKKFITNGLTNEKVDVVIKQKSADMIVVTKNSTVLTVYSQNGEGIKISNSKKTPKGEL